MMNYDDNPDILTIVEEHTSKSVINRVIERMKKGYDSYGHGLRKDDDTRQYGTKMNSWYEMAEEEILDAIVYISAQQLRKNETVNSDLLVKLNDICTMLNTLNSTE